MPASRNFYLGKRLGQLSRSLSDDGTISTGSTFETSVSTVATSVALDSAGVTNLINAAYIQARQADIYRDSAFVTNIVNASYIQANQAASGVDSAAVLSLIDSSYVSARAGAGGGASSGTADLTKLDITDISGTDGNPGDLLQSLGNGNVGWQTNGSLTYSLKVTYSSSDVDSVQDLPAGWTVDSQGTTFITLSHNTGKTLKDVSYLSYNSTEGKLQLNKIANKEHATAPLRQPTEKVTLKVDATTTNTSNDQFTYVNLVF